MGKLARRRRRNPTLFQVGWRGLSRGQKIEYGVGFGALLAAAALAFYREWKAMHAPTAASLVGKKVQFNGVIWTVTAANADGSVALSSTQQTALGPATVSTTQLPQSVTVVA